MLKKVLENKKILIGLLITLFAVILVAVYMLAGNDSEKSKKTPTSNIEVESEEGLDVVGEDENVPEEESDTSAFWEENKSDNKQNEDKSEDKSQTDKNETDDTDKEDKNEERKRDPDSEIIVATVSLFGTTEDMMMHQALTKDEADKLIKLAKQEGAGNLMKRIIDAL